MDRFKLSLVKINTCHECMCLIEKKMFICINFYVAADFNINKKNS